MKNKIKFYIMILKRDENDNLKYEFDLALVTKFDENTYYYSPAYMKDYYKSFMLRRYIIFDKYTGIAIALGGTRKEVIENYNKVKSKYDEERKEDDYKELIKKYQELLKNERTERSTC